MSSRAAPSEGLFVARGSEGRGPRWLPLFGVIKLLGRSTRRRLPVVEWDVDGQREAGNQLPAGKVVMVAIGEILRYLPVGMKARGPRIRLCRAFASERLVVVRMSAIDNSLKHIAQRVGEGKHVVLCGGEDGNLFNFVGGITVLGGEAIVVDGPGHEQSAADTKARGQAVDGLENDSRAQGVRGKAQANGTGEVGVKESGEQLPGVDRLVTFDNVIDEDREDTIAGPKYSDWNSVPDLQVTQPISEVRNAVRLIDLEAVSAEEHFAAADGREQFRREVTGIAGAVCIEDPDRADGAANGVGASAQKPTRHDPSNASKTGSPVPPCLWRRRYPWQLGRSGLRSIQSGQPARPRSDSE